MSVKDQLLALRATIPSEMVNVPGVGEVEIRGLTAAGRDEWEQRIVSAKSRTVRNIRASLVALCVYANGKPVFGSADIDSIGEMPAQVVDRLYGVATRLSGLGVKDQEELEGNSESAR
jgi:hypothetical protein